MTALKEIVKTLVRRKADDDSRTLAALLTAADDSYDRVAWEELLALWSVRLPPTADLDICEFAKLYGLLCSGEQGNWGLLRQLDRPVILQLAAADGHLVPVVLQHLDDKFAELIIGNDLYRLKIGQLEHFWAGDYSLLLQMPPGGKMLLRAGVQAEDVKWLREQLETVLDVEIAAVNPLLFDQELKRNLQDFQRGHGLEPDGMMGKNTIIHLNTQSSPAGIPRLSAERS